MQGRKDDMDKPRYDLIGPKSLSGLAQVLTFGAKKYGPENWKNVPDLKRRYFSAAMRHLWAWFAGEKNDPESGLNHLYHAMACIFFLAEDDVTK